MVFELESFDPSELPVLLETLVELGRADLRRARRQGRPLPALYRGAIVYRREPRGRERWRSVRHVAAEGFGDCEDLAAYRAAELREGGEAGARAVLVRRGPHLIHAVVRRADGRIEDPSRRLGM